MNRYKAKIENLSNHVKQNPRDWQSAISLLKLNSQQIDYERKKKQQSARLSIKAYKEA